MCKELGENLTDEELQVRPANVTCAFVSMHVCVCVCMYEREKEIKAEEKTTII